LSLVAAAGVCLLRGFSFAVAGEGLYRGLAFWHIKGRIFDVVAEG
jgi:hypothetical protein